METAVQTIHEIVARIRSHGEVIRHLGMHRLGLFGSFVHGQPHAESDVDVLVVFEPGRKSFDSFMRLSLLLEELLGRRVELVTPESLSPYIGPRILDEVAYVLDGA